MEVLVALKEGRLDSDRTPDMQAVSMVALNMVSSLEVVGSPPGFGYMLGYSSYLLDQREVNRKLVTFHSNHRPRLSWRKDQGLCRRPIGSRLPKSKLI